MEQSEARPSPSPSSIWEWDNQLLIAVAAIVAGLIVLRISGSGGGRAKRLPPGPRPWPIVGNLGQLGGVLHQDLAKLADKYGPILSLRLGSVPAVVVSSPQLAEEVLRTHDRMFASRPRTSGTRILSYDNQNITFAPYGPYWRQARKLFTLELFTARRLRSFQAMRTEEVLRTLRSVLVECKDGAAVVCMVDKFGELAWNIISRMMISKRYFSDSGAADAKKLSRGSVGEYVQVLKEVVRSFGADPVGDFIPLLRGLDLKGVVRQMWKSRRRMDSILDKIIEEHRQQLNLSPVAAGPGRRDDDMDIVDVMLTRPGGVDDDDKPRTVSQMKGILGNAFVAGTDTSSNTLAWAMAELLRNPKVLERAQQELDEVVGRHRLVEEADIPRLPYLRAIVKENFRLHPVVPLLIPHVSLEDCEVGGYYIPARTRVFIHAWAIGRNASVWDRALDFYPERFLGNEVDVVGQDFELLPFGSGRRSCPGRPLGLLTVQYALAACLHACDWRLPPGMKAQDIDFSELSGVTMPMAIPLHLVATPRLPLSLLQ